MQCILNYNKIKFKLLLLCTKTVSWWFVPSGKWLEEANCVNATVIYEYLSELRKGQSLFLSRFFIELLLHQHSIIFNLVAGVLRSPTFATQFTASYITFLLPWKHC